MKKIKANRFEVKMGVISVNCAHLAVVIIHTKRNRKSVVPLILLFKFYSRLPAELNVYLKS